MTATDSLKVTCTFKWTVLFITSIHVLEHREIRILLHWIWFILKYFSSLPLFHNQTHLSAHGDFVTQCCAACPFYSVTVAVTGFRDGCRGTITGGTYRNWKLIHIRLFIIIRLKWYVYGMQGAILENDSLVRPRPKDGSTVSTAVSEAAKKLRAIHIQKKCDVKILLI